MDIRTRIWTDLNPSKRIRFRIRSENIRTVFIPAHSPRSSRTWTWQMENTWIHPSGAGQDIFARWKRHMDRCTPAPIRRMKSFQARRSTRRWTKEKVITGWSPSLYWITNAQLLKLSLFGLRHRLIQNQSVLPSVQQFLKNHPVLQITLAGKITKDESVIDPFNSRCKPNR